MIRRSGVNSRPPPEVRSALAPDQKGLVDIVVLDRAVGFQVGTAQGARNCLRRAVTEAVGVADTFVLADLKLWPRNTRTRTPLDNKTRRFSHSLAWIRVPPPSAGRTV